MKTKQEYENYQATVARFFEATGLHNLTAIENAEPCFSTTPCECCRRQLGGDRIAANGYNSSSKEVLDFNVCTDCLYYAEYGQLDDQTMLDIGE